MPTLEQFALALDAIQNLKNLRKDIKENAAAYRRQINAGKDPATIKEVAREDLAQYKRRLAWHFAGDIAVDVQLALDAIGVTDHDKEFTELNNTVIELESVLVGGGDVLEAAIDATEALAERKVFFKPQGA